MTKSDGLVLPFGELDNSEIVLRERIDKMRALMKPGKPSTRITRDLAAIIKRLRIEGYYNHQIASMVGCNQGRIAEVNRGHSFAEVPPAHI